MYLFSVLSYFLFFFNDTATTEIYTLSLHDALPISGFGRTDTHELPSSLTWGPDGWLYGLNGVFNRSRSEEHTSELQSLTNLVCRLLLEKKKKKKKKITHKT